MCAGVGLLLLDRRLELVDRPGELVHGVGVLFHQIAHHPHAFVEGALHAGDLLLQHLHLRLDLDDFFADGPERRGGS